MNDTSQSDLPLHLSGASPLQVTQTTDGARLSLDALPQLRLFELTSNLEVAMTGELNDDVPSASAKHLHYDRAENRYKAVDNLQEVTLYDVLVYHDSNNNPLGIAALREGHRTWARFNEQSGRWEILREPTEVWRFVLLEDLQQGGSAMALLVGWDDSVGDYVTSAVAFTVYDSRELFAGVPGDEGFARFFADSDRWEVIALGKEVDVVRFELTADKSIGANAIGELLEWNGGQGDYEKQGLTVGLIDSYGVWRSHSGCRGWAIRMRDRSKITLHLPNPPGDAVEYDAYEILWVEGPARWIRFTLNEDMGATNADEATATVEAFWGEADNGKGPGSTITVYDRIAGITLPPHQPSAFAHAKAEDQGLAVYDEQRDRYVIVWLRSKPRFVEFTLDEGVGDTNGGQAQALVDAWWGAPLFSIVPDDTVQVHDRQGLFADSRAGSKGLAVLDEQDDEFVIVRCQTYRPYVVFVLDAPLTTNDFTTIGSLSAQYGPGVDNLSGTITLLNVSEHTFGRYIFEGDTGDQGLALHSGGNSYVIVNMECT